MKMNPRDMDWKDFVHADHLTSLRDDDDSDDGDDDELAETFDGLDEEAKQDVLQTDDDKDKTMKLSAVMKKHIATTDPKADPWKVGMRVETMTDAHRVVHSQDDFDSYVKQFGDVEVVYDEQFNVYHVPAFKVERDSYIKGKAATLASSSYGCEQQ